ncbi:MAG: hypothetical protein IKG46_12580 [Solobacterium sp.]|nr:hypothetical protein [Solobacterium sp.]
MRLFDRQGSVDSIEQKEEWFHQRKGKYSINQDKLLNIPGSPIAYWVEEKVIDSFKLNKICDYAVAVKGLDVTPIMPKELL